MNDGILHEKAERKYWIPERKLVSLLDILGGGNVECVNCGRWQSFSALTTEMATEYLEKYGWRIVIGGDDLCPICAKAGATQEGVSQ